MHLRIAKSAEREIAIMLASTQRDGRMRAFAQVEGFKNANFPE
jgi:hypothetical protein